MNMSIYFIYNSGHRSLIKVYFNCTSQKESINVYSRKKQNTLFMSLEFCPNEVYLKYTYE